MLQFFCNIGDIGLTVQLANHPAATRHDIPVVNLESTDPSIEPEVIPHLTALAWRWAWLRT
jgi:hypothetical protein